MIEGRKGYQGNNVVEHETKLYILAQKLKDVAAEMDKLSEEEKQIVIERTDKKDELVMKNLYDTLNDYMGGNLPLFKYF